MAHAKKRRIVRRQAKGTRATHRPWCLPPAVTREPGETLEGMHVLGEFPSELALPLWMALRDVMLWAATPEERRATLFTPAAEARRREEAAATRLDPALDLALGTLATVVSHAGQASATVVALMCLEVSRWARGRGGMGTAVSFAQAAALAVPDDPGPALAVGQLAVEWGRPARAETWLRRCVGLARRARDWERYGAACVTLGEIHLRAERLDGAERFYLLGARVGRRQRLRTVRAEATHGLMRLAMLTGDLEAAGRYAHAAQRAYGRTNPRAAYLQHDWAHVLVRMGDYEAAVPRLRRQLEVFTDAGMRMACHALLAHVAAATGDARAYELSWKEAWTLKDRAGAAVHLPEALRHLGRAAAAVHDWLRVQQAVRAFSDLPPTTRRGPAADDVAQLDAMVATHRQTQRANGEPTAAAALTAP